MMMLKIQIDFELLYLYERWSKTKLHLETSQSLLISYRENKFNGEQKKIFLHEVSRKSALLQKKILKGSYKHAKKAKKQNINYAIEYLKIQLKISQKSSHKIQFYMAEMHYAAGQFNEAIELYYRVHYEAIRKNDKKMARLALNNLLFSLNEKNVSQKVRDEYSRKAYFAYLSHFPRTKKAFKIYQRLFSSLIKKGKILDAEKVLFKFRAYFPRAVVKQEVMLGEVIDFYKKRNDRKGLEKWVKKIRKGEFKINTKMAKGLNNSLVNIQFGRIEKITQDKGKAQALREYLKIYKNPQVSSKARQKAALLITNLYYKARKINFSYKWGLKTLDLMTPREIEMHQGTFYLIANALFYQRLYKNSFTMYDRVLKKLCRSKSKVKSKFFKNAFGALLVDNKQRYLEQMIERGRNCGIQKSYLKEARMKRAELLVDLKLWSELDKLIEGLSFSSMLINLHAQLSKAYRHRGYERRASFLDDKIIRIYKNLKSKKKKISIESLDVVASIKLRESRKIFKSLKALRLSYPREKYQHVLGKKLALLEKLEKEKKKIQPVRSGKGVVEFYHIHALAYQNIIDDIKKFTPPGKPKPYRQQFKKEMNKIISSLEKAQKNYQRGIKREILSQEILSSFNGNFLNFQEHPVNPVLILKKPGFFMDKSGGR